jgi:hypothetical protein
MKSLNIFIVTILFFFAFGYYREKISERNKSEISTEEVKYVKDEVTKILDTFDKNMMSEDFESPKDIPLMENPQSDEEIVVNLIREHTNRLNSITSNYQNKLIELKTFVVVGDLNGIKEILMALSYEDINQDIGQATKLAGDYLNLFKKEKEDLFKEALSINFSNPDFLKGFESSSKTSITKAVNFQSSMTALDLKYFNLTGEMAKALKNCIDDWSTEETSEGFIFNFENLSYEDSSEIYMLSEKMDEISEEQVELFQMHQQTIRDKIQKF